MLTYYETKMCDMFRILSRKVYLKDCELGCGRLKESNTHSLTIANL